MLAFFLPLCYSTAEKGMKFSRSVMLEARF